MVNSEGIRVGAKIYNGTLDGNVWLCTHSQLKEIPSEDNDITLTNANRFESTRFWQNSFKPLLDQASSAGILANRTKMIAESKEATDESRQLYNHAQQELIDSMSIRDFDLLDFESKLKSSWSGTLPKETTIECAG